MKTTKITLEFDGHNIDMIQSILSFCKNREIRIQNIQATNDPGLNTAGFGLGIGQPGYVMCKNDTASEAQLDN